MGYSFSCLLFCSIWLKCHVGEALQHHHRNLYDRVQPLCLASTRGGPRRRRKRPPPSKGFGSSSTEAEPMVESTSDGETKVETAKPIYSMPTLYDLAFGYRDYEEEVEFLISQHQALHEGKAPERILELAAGPARHSIFALASSYVKHATALDNSPEMVEYGKTIAMEELNESEKKDSFDYIEADMENFQLPGDLLYDSAWILLGSLQHMTGNSQVTNCFQSIYDALNPGGTLILELPHPRETFSMAECTKNGWQVPLEDENGEQSGELEIIWGDDHDEFNPITQVRQFTVGMVLKGDDSRDNPDLLLQSVREIVPMRLFTTQEIAALAQIAGFRIRSLHGALAHDVDVNGEEEAFRLVCVLQKE